MNYIPSRLLRASADGEAPGALVTQSQIRLAFIHGSQDGVIDSDEKDLSLNVMDFAETSIDRVMTFRGDIVSLPAETKVSEAYALVRDHGYSRIPLYETNDPDNIVGFLNVKDLFESFLGGEQNGTLDELKREFTFVPEKKKTLEQLGDFQRDHAHIAMVVDEAGNIVGLVTLEDLLEEVVGEIYDEHDRPETLLRKVGAGNYLLDGRFEIDTFNRAFSRDLDETDYSTIGGYIMGLFGKVPDEGMSTRHEGMDFTVKRMDGHRIDQLEVRLS